MDDRLKKRIVLFYVAGILNAFFGMYVLFEGGKVLPQQTVTWLVVLCVVFAALNFYMAWALRKKWEEAQARLRAQQAAAEGKGDAPG
jgi:drug/metabolite transporter (DMT)-like permease